MAFTRCGRAGSAAHLSVSSKDHHQVRLECSALSLMMGLSTCSSLVCDKHSKYIRESGGQGAAVATFEHSLRSACAELAGISCPTTVGNRLAIAVPTGEYITAVWDKMMEHFMGHTQKVVQFARQIPGFADMSDQDKVMLIKNSVYPITLVLLANDYDEEAGEYNYFNFSPAERTLIIDTFPNFKTIAAHCVRVGRALKPLALDKIESAFLCCMLLFAREDGEDEELANKTLPMDILSRCSSAFENYIVRKHRRVFRYTEIMLTLSTLQLCQNEHRRVLQKLRSIWPFLNFPPVYAEMFNVHQSTAGDSKVSHLVTARTHKLLQNV